MAESHKFTDVEKLREVFPSVRIETNLDTGTVKVYNEKEDSYEALEKGSFVVKIADRYEVHGEEPEKAKPAEAPKASKKAAKSEDSEATPAPDYDKAAEETPKAVEGKQTVVPEELGTAPGPESK